MAYVAGRALSTFQTAAVSGLYLAASLPMAMSYVFGTQAWAAIMPSHSTVLDAVILNSEDYWDIYMAIVLIAVVTVSLCFLVDIRTKRHGKAVA